MRSFISIIILEVYRVIAYFAGVVLILLLFSVTRISFAATPGEEFEVHLQNIWFNKVTENVKTGEKYPHEPYKWSRFLDDMGQEGEGTFIEQQDHSGVYELIWAPPRDKTTYIKRYLNIKVVLSSKYSNPAERNIKSLEYTYLQDTENPAKPKDLGIHKWVLKAKNIKFAFPNANKLIFNTEGAEVCDDITKYEAVNQGNDVYRSIETIRSCDDKKDSDKPSGLTVELNIDRQWWIPSPDISVWPRRMDFGRLGMGGSLVKEIEIRNNGDKTLSVDSLKIIGPGLVEFTAGPIRSEQISPGDYTRLGMTYQPRHVGRSEAWLKIYSNDPDEPVVTVPLTGSGYDHVTFITAAVYLRLLLSND